MAVSKAECDICGPGNESNGIHLCMRCTFLEEQFGGDLAKVSDFVHG